MPIRFTPPASVSPTAWLSPIRTQTEEPPVSEYKKADERLFDPETGQLVAAAGDMVPADVHKKAVGEAEWEKKMQTGYDPVKASREGKGVGVPTSSLQTDPKPLGATGLIEAGALAETTPTHHLPAEHSHHLPDDQTAQQVIGARGAEQRKTTRK